MKNKFIASFALFYLCTMLGLVQAVTQTASIRLNGNVTYQKVTGFGGSVCSPQFSYNHMTTDEIRKIWGKNSELGYNILRLYLPIGESAWSQSLETARLAKSLGIIVFASPWSMPAEWKTNNNIAAKYTDANGVVQIGSLKEENYADYANYLNNYVLYLRNNGVELDAISIQNEPDWQATYAGCIWTPAQIAKFISTYGRTISCKIIAPESIGITDNYSTALSDNTVIDKFDIFAGHQYGSLQTGFQSLQTKGKEAWMTEFLINWNADENTTRDFNWTKDAFNFANKVNTALLTNINAWVHYAAKRYYGLIGDGTNGTTTGVITKRGYILSHYAKYTTGATRISNTWNDNTNVLQGSSYLSVTRDSVIVMVINPSTDSYNLTVDLPFYTTSGKSITTSESLNMYNSPITVSSETCRPKVTINASSVTTLIFTKSSVRPASQMTGAAFHYSKIDNQTVTNAAFGTSYKMSGTTVTFDHSNNLISSNISNSNGYINLDDRYNRLVFHINSITSALNYTASNTTLYYINGNGAVSSYNYGTINFNQAGNYDWILDISRSVLTDGCTGILGISNGNYSSILTINLGDVYFKVGNEKMYKFTGVYSKGDSNLLDCLDDAAYTSFDFSGTTGITSDQDWNASNANKNCIFYVPNDVTNSNNNVITGTSCSKLVLTDTGGDFFVPTNFTATSASYSRTFDGYGIIVLPFEANIPTGATAFTLQSSNAEVACNQISNNKIPANTPVLIKGTGTFTFAGSGAVSTPKALNVNDMNGTYIAVKAPANSYSLKTVNGVTGFYRVTSGTEPTIIPFSAYLTNNNYSAPMLTLKLNTTDINQIKEGDEVGTANAIIYDLWGRRIYNPVKGVVYIKAGKKFVF